MGMDRAIKKKRWTAKRIILLSVAAGGLGWLIWATASVSGKSTYRMERDYAAIATVQKGEFRDYIALRGTVEPYRSMPINISQGGTVEEIYSEVGDFVKANDPLVKFHDPNFELGVLDKAGTISEQINRSSETRLQLEKSLRDLRTQLNDTAYRIETKQRELSRKQALLEKQLISKDQIENLEFDLKHEIEQRKRLSEDLVREEKAFPRKIQQLNESDERAQKHLEIVEASMDNLVTRAPISGQIVEMEIELGEQKGSGVLGRIDDVSKFIVVADVDEYYLNRVKAGQTAIFELGNEELTAIVNKVYPQIKSGRFEINLELPESEEVVNQLRRGLSLQLQLELGAANQSLLLANGSFINDTGGNWAFVLNESGDVATKRDIRLGRKNNDSIEVQGGLREGEQVIISSYAGLEDFDEIILTN